MGRSDGKKMNKNHHKQKMFRMGISVGRNDLNLEGHLQFGFCSKTVKNYSLVGDNAKRLEGDQLAEIDKPISGESTIIGESPTTDAQIDQE